MFGEPASQSTIELIGEAMPRPWHCFNAPDCDQQRICHSALNDIHFAVGAHSSAP
jgi:hypothetical protein